MSKSSSRNQVLIGLALAALMALTRSHHIPGFPHLLDASWAVVFLAGVYLRPRLVLPLLLAEAVLIDYLAITYGGVSSFCVSSAYAALAPAYGALWLAGRWYAGRARFQADTLVPFTVSLVAGAAACELVSSGSFYYLSGRFAAPTLTGFGARLVAYFPGDAQSLLFYVGLAVVTHALLMLSRRGAQTGAKAR
ncbi:MAG: hypothetical protein KGL26_09925 [Pseudomonadota bacterium]|nr:hypothetical protein [Pseudomonadota bacterium]